MLADVLPTGYEVGVLAVIEHATRRIRILWVTLHPTGERTSQQAREPDDGPLRRILRAYETHHHQHRPHRPLDSAAPLKPLPEPVDLEQHRIRRHPQVDGMINEYHLVA